MTETTKPSISMVIAAFNEEGNVEDAVHTVLNALGNRFSSYEIIVVDDGSTDRTPQIIDRLANENPSIKAVHNERNRGMGFSLRRGMLLAVKDYVGSSPGDNGLVEGALTAMFDLVGQADVIGYSIANPEFRNHRRRFISHAYTVLMNTLFGLNMPYYNGHAIYRRELIQKLPVFSEGHSFLSESLIRLVKAGHSYKIIPTVQRERAHGRTSAFRLKTIKNVLMGITRLFWEIRIQG